MDADDTYIELLLEPLRKCAAYLPAFGQDGSTGTTIEVFRTLYGADPLYHWCGLDSDLMYAAHKATGGMTSIYRQLGIGCERLFREVTKSALGLSNDEIAWGYTVETKSGIRALALDARIDLRHVRDPKSYQRIHGWLLKACASLDIDPDARQIHGAVFEVRQGYKSADSKRQNADLQNGVRAYAEGYLPVVLVFSRQLNATIERRYRNALLLILVGQLTGTEIQSTFAFCRDVVGYDMGAFFERNAARLRAELNTILHSLLSPA